MFAVGDQKPTRSLFHYSFRDNNYIVLDSLDRDISKYPSASTYVVELPETIRNVQSIELMSLQMIRAEPNVHSGNQTIQVSYSNSAYIPVTIAKAEYTSGSNLAAALQSSLNTAYPAASFTVSYTDSTALLSIGAVNTFSIQFGELSASLYGYYGNGVRGAGTVTATFVSPGVYRMAGTRAVDLRGTPYVVLTINDYDRNISASSAVQKTFMVVPLESQPYGKRFLMCGDEKERKGLYVLINNQQVMKEMRVTITRPDGSLYDFNGTDHHMVFRLTKNRIHDFNT